MDKQSIKALKIKLQQGSLLPASLLKELDSASYLAYRDRADFDTEWIGAYQKLERDRLTEAEQAQITEWSRLAFTQVMQGGGDSDLAAYISDDIDMICTASLLEVEDQFIDRLIEDYSAERLPV